VPPAARLAALPALVALLALTGCGAPPPGQEEPVGPSPSTAPTSEQPVEPAGPVALEDLYLTADGLGALVLGEVAVDDPELGLVHLDPLACTDEVTGFDLGIDAGSVLAPLWLANDPYLVDGRPSFGVSVDPAGIVTRIDLFGDAIPTEEGVRVGDPAAAVLEAYPDAPVTEGDLSDLLVIEGETGLLLVEIAREREIYGVPYWDDILVDRVLFIGAVLGSEPFSVAGSDNVAGVCPF